MPIHILQLIERHTIARNTIEFVFSKPKNFSFKPGQYAGFTLINPIETDAGGITRRFSILSTPSDEHIRIVTRIQDSAYKRVLCTLPIGSEIKFAGPTGTFTLHEDATIPAVLIAGGVGIAPFYCMIKHAANQQSTQPIFLFYGNQTFEDGAFLKELADIEHPSFKLIASLAQPGPNWEGETGFISEIMIKKHILDLSLPIYYICGSPAMVTAIQEILVEMGIRDDRIKVEDFPGY